MIYFNILELFVLASVFKQQLKICVSILVAALVQICLGLAYGESSKSGQYCALIFLAQYFT
jgi:hypothetical protein